jgi:hypothetical protein
MKKSLDVLLIILIVYIFLLAGFEIWFMFAKKFSNISGKYRQNSDQEKYVGSFSIPPVQCENRLMPAHVRPSADGTYYTVTLNGSFFTHLSKDAEGWQDSKGERSELNSLVGKLIEEHEKSK